MSTSEELKEKYDQHVEAGFVDPYRAETDKLINEYKNANFSYDPEADEGFKQYAKLMREQGAAAMEDTVGRASAMTGGFANSYAQTAGQDTYNQYLKNIDAKAEDFYSRAHSDFSNEQNQRLATISMLQNKSNTARAEWDAETQRLYNEYTDAYTREWNEDERNRADKAEKLETAFLAAQYGGDYSQVEELLGLEPGTVESRLAAEAEDENAFDKALLTAQYTGDYSLLEDYLGVESGSIEKYLAEQAVVESESELESFTNSLKTPPDSIMTEALNTLLGKGYVEQGLDKAIEDIAASYIAMGYSDMSEWLLQQFKKYEFVKDRTFTHISGSGDDAIYSDQFGNRFYRDEIYNWIIDQGGTKNEAKNFIEALGKGKA